MTRREHDICFAPDERLWRAVSADMLTRHGKVKANALRLQVSVARSSKGRQSMEAAFNPSAPPKINGVAEITVDAVRSVKTELVYAVCVDEPVEHCQEHALIAIVTTAPPGSVSPADINAARLLLADKMAIAMKPL